MVVEHPEQFEQYIMFKSQGSMDRTALSNFLWVISGPHPRRPATTGCRESYRVGDNLVFYILVGDSLRSRIDKRSSE